MTHDFTFKGKSFADLVVQMASQRKKEPFYGTLVCYDPGETTGYAVFRNQELVESGQFDTKDLIEGSKTVYHHLQGWFIAYGASEWGDFQVVTENYRVYGWKTEQHTWAELHTPKLVGAITAICAISDYRFHQQMAHTAKQFCTDDKLREWGLYQPGKRHARDAIRHGCYFQLFGKVIDPKPKPKTFAG